MTSAVEVDRVGKPRPTTIPSGKYEGVPIAWLANDDLIFLRHEFRYADQTVQAAVMAERASCGGGPRRNA
jgi:hypothetical protein